MVKVWGARFSGCSYGFQRLQGPTLTTLAAKADMATKASLSSAKRCPKQKVVLSAAPPDCPTARPPDRLER